LKFNKIYFTLTLRGKQCLSGARGGTWVTDTGDCYFIDDLLDEK